MSKHTKGPWVVENAASEHLHDICLGYDIKDAGNPVVVAVVFYNEDGPITLEQANANARLCAASPGLLQACKDMLPLLIHAEKCEASADDGYGDRLRELRRRLAFVRATISQAEGKTDV